MGTVHRLLEQHGVEQARNMVETKAQRAALEAAYELMSEEETRLGITHAGFALTSLPHRRIADRIWRREGHMTTLLIESGSDREGQPIGVPYGSVARLILLYLQSEAVRTRSPEVELGKSMRSWMARMGMSIGGRTYNVVGEQATKLSSCRLTFFTGPVGEVGEARHNGSFVRDSISLSGVTDAKQESLWQPRVRLDERFYESLMRHPVPVRGSDSRDRHTIDGDRHLRMARLSTTLADEDNANHMAIPLQPVRRRMQISAANEATLPRKPGDRVGGVSRSTTRGRQEEDGSASITTSRPENPSARDINTSSLKRRQEAPDFMLASHDAARTYYAARWQRTAPRTRPRRINGSSLA